jgi:hypothetical protein
MADEQIHGRIEQLIEEEQALYERAGHEGGLTDDERRRLDALQVRLDQLWDLLRQRRALREAGRDPSDAQVRDPEVVEHYEQ